MPETVDWFAATGIVSKYCESCGEGDEDWCDDCEQCNCCDGTCECRNYCPNCGPDDSDWCEDCDGCRFSNCDTCTCEREFEITVTYYITIEATSEENITKSMVHDAVCDSYPDDWSVD